MGKHRRTVGEINSGAWFLTLPSQILWSTICPKEVRSILIGRLYPPREKVFIVVCVILIHFVKSIVSPKMEMLR